MNVDEDVEISETVVVVKNTERWGVAGSSPLADYNKRVHVLLSEKVAQIWDNFVGSPKAEDMIIGNTWRTSAKDIEIHFRHNSVAKPVQNRSTDHRYQLYFAYVDAHIFVNGAQPDTEPAELHSVESGLDRVIELNATELVPHAECKVTNYQPGSEEVADDLTTLWHSQMTIEITFWKVKAL